MVAELGCRQRPVRARSILLHVVALALSSWSSAAVRSAALAERPATVEAMSTRLGTPATSLDAVSHRQEVAEAASSARRRQHDGRAGWSLTSRAFARALSTRMVVLMEHARSAIEQLPLAVKSEERHADAQLYCLLVKHVRDGAMKEARHASVARLRGKEYGPNRKEKVPSYFQCALESAAQGAAG